MRITTSIRLAPVPRIAGGFQPHTADVRPEGGEARCVSSARRDPCGEVIVVLVRASGHVRCNMAVIRGYRDLNGACRFGLAYYPKLPMWGVHSTSTRFAGDAG